MMYPLRVYVLLLLCIQVVQHVVVYQWIFHFVRRAAAAHHQYRYRNNEYSASNEKQKKWKIKKKATEEEEKNWIAAARFEMRNCL